jgi:Flp pilus assembly protein TadG
MVEFAMVTVPFILAMISCLEMARGMWLYHSLSNAVRVVARYATVHGTDCQTTYSCSITVGGMATLFEQTAPGLPPSSTTLTLTSTSGTVTCSPVSSCTTTTTTWPPSAGATVGNAITVTAYLTFHSGMASLAGGFKDPTFIATSQQIILF